MAVSTAADRSASDGPQRQRQLLTVTNGRNRPKVVIVERQEERFKLGAKADGWTTPR